jgi:hypothetical protein
MVTELLLNAEVHYIQHCTENSKQIFPEMKLRGLVPNFGIHVYIPTIGLQFCCIAFADRGLIVRIYKWLTNT